uniref:Ionotropic glutamate receptor L-glutamate and glycine-binding domain-containing protein n=1 Tax=Anopheles albimanus TaxID=7167 RepID=A0A8W7JBB3_ANOAL
MKCSSELFVLLLALLSYFAIPVHGQKRLIIHHAPVVGSVGELLHQTVTIHLRNSAAGVCYFGAGGARVAFRRIIHDTLRDMDAFGGSRSMNVQRFCETGSCSASMQASPTKCGLSVVAVPGRLQHTLESLANNVPYWNSSAIHVFLLDNYRQMESDLQLTYYLARYGVIRVLLVCIAGPANRFHIRFPILFQRRTIVVTPDEAQHYLARFDQMANLRGFQIRTLFHARIPYLHKYQGVFGGADNVFLQTVVERLNATHLWIYHTHNDRKLNTTNLHEVDQIFLSSGRTSFSINRLLPSTLRRLYLNTFDGTCVLVPRKPLQSFILRLWQPFSQYLWYLVLLLAVAAILVNLVLPRLFSVNYLLALLFGGVAAVYQLRALDRTVLSVLDVLLFLLKEAYTAKIITYMVQIRYEPELETMAELARSGPPLLIRPSDYESHQERLASVPGLRTQVRTDYSLIGTAWTSYFTTTHAHVIPCSYGRSLVHSHAMSEPDAPQFYVLREQLLIQPEAFTFPHYTLLIERMRFYIACLTESGIYGHWLREDFYYREWTIEPDEILRFEKMASLFYVLLVGYAAAMVVFMLELFIPRTASGVRLVKQQPKGQQIGLRGDPLTSWKQPFWNTIGRWKKRIRRRVQPLNERQLSVPCAYD